MSLIDLAAMKRVLKLEDSTAEDTLIAELLARATALVESYLDCPIAAESDVEMVDEAETMRFGSIGPRALMLPLVPVDPDSVAIADVDATALDMTLLRVDGRTGLVRYLDGCTRFTNGPYTITADRGLATLPEYATRIEPVVNAAIADTVVDLYARRNPSLQSEGVASGLSRTYALTGLTDRVTQSLDRIRVTP